MTCKCPNCGAALTVTLSAACVNVVVPEAKATVAKAPKFTNSNMGKLRKCLHAVGLKHDATIFNDCGVVRQDGTQRRRLKVWSAAYTPAQASFLAEQCAEEFGDDLISAGVVTMTRFGRTRSSFCVYLKVQ